MAEGTLQILGLGTSAAPLEYTVSGNQPLELIAVKATFDGSASAGSFLPVVEIVSTADQVMAQGIGESVAAGGSATVTFAPFLGAQAGTTPTTSGALTLLSTTVLAAPGVFNFNSISQAYSDLIVVGILRSAAAASVDGVQMTINGSGLADYSIQYVRGNSVNATAAGSTNGTSAEIGFVTGATGDANQYGTVELVLPGYSDSTHSRFKQGSSVTATSRGGGSFPDILVFEWGWPHTAAITDLQFFAGAGPNFAVGSEMRLYGRL